MGRSWDVHARGQSDEVPIVHARASRVGYSPRVAALSGVSFLEHLEVIGLIAGGASQIKGVEVRRRAGAAVEADQADLSAEVHPPGRAEAIPPLPAFSGSPGLGVP